MKSEEAEGCVGCGSIGPDHLEGCDERAAYVDAVVGEVVANGGRTMAYVIDLPGEDERYKTREEAEERAGELYDGGAR